MTNHTIAVTLLTLGGILLAGLAADVVGRRTRLPRVTLLLLLGVAVGPLGMDLFPETSANWFPLVADFALVMVAFLLGGELTPEMLREHGRTVLSTSLIVVTVTMLIVGAGLWVLGWPWPVAVLLAAVSISTAPAAVSDVVRETRARGPLTKVLLGVVAVDDAWGILVMSFALALVLGVTQPEAGAVVRDVLRSGGFELVGAILVGCGVGVPLALLSGRVREGEPTQAEALGGVFLCGGLALSLDVSLLLAAMTMGVVVANLARHHRRPFRAIEGIEWPFMVLFFVLSGASFGSHPLPSVAALTAAYIGLRVAGRMIGGFASAQLNVPERRVRGIGPALLPQAGVAIGLALIASQRLPDVGPVILAATVASTIVFEVTGPLLTRRALLAAGEGFAVPPE